MQSTPLLAKIALYGLLLLIVVSVVILLKWHPGYASHQGVRVENNTDAPLLIVDVSGKCSWEIPAHGDSTYQDDAFLCKRPTLLFESSLFGEVTCTWAEARAHQPVVVMSESVSCYDGPLPTPFPSPSSPPLR